MLHVIFFGILVLGIIFIIDDNIGSVDISFKDGFDCIFFVCEVHYVMGVR